MRGANNDKYLQTERIAMEIERREKLTVQAACELLNAIGMGNEKTIADYKNRIPLYIQFIEQHGMDYRVLFDYRKWLEGKSDWKASTKNKYFVAAKKLSKVLYHTKQIPVDITCNLAGEPIKGFGSGKYHKKNGLSQGDVDKLTDFLASLPETPKASRLKAMISLLIYQGLRQVEVSRLMVEDIDLEDGIIFIQGKGQDDKEPAVLQNKTIEHLAQYIQDHNLKSGPLFFSNTTSTVGNNLSTRRIRELVKDTYRKAGVAEKRTTHDTRHYYATVIKKACKGDVLKMRRYTRHRNVNMLLTYVDEIDMREDKGQIEQAFDNVKF